MCACLFYVSLTLSVHISHSLGVLVFIFVPSCSQIDNHGIKFCNCFQTGFLLNRKIKFKKKTFKKHTNRVYSFQVVDFLFLFISFTGFFPNRIIWMDGRFFLSLRRVCVIFCRPFVFWNDSFGIRYTVNDCSFWLYTEI